MATTPDSGGATSDGSSSGGHTVIVPDAHLLFSGDYKRAGLDLVLSKDGHEHVVPDYFKGVARATLASPDGAHLSGDLVTALTGEVQVAQLGGAAAAAPVIGTVTRLTGSATAIRNGVSIQLNMGDTVNKGDVVQAGAESTLGITFIDGTVFGLSANARMVLNEMVYDPNGSSNSSLLSLVQGTITFVAGETAKKGDMRVDTPVATMGIRGTAVLVEIGFEVPGQGGAPPVSFQVLVEPGGKVGSYVLYSRADPTVVIGTVNAAGQVTSVTGTGDALTSPAPPLSPEALAIIAPIFQLYFPNVPNPNPSGTVPGGGSPPPGTVPGSSDPQPLNFNPFQGLTPEVPRIIPINLPDAPPGTPPVLVTVTRPNTAPVIESARLAVSEGGTVVLGAGSIGVVDTTSTAFTFTVSGVSHGAFHTSADGIVWVAATSFTTAQLIAGRVRFVHDGSEAAPTFTIRADDGAVLNSASNLLPGSVVFTNVNDAPVITSAGLSVTQGGIVLITLANVGITDPDSSSFTYYGTATHGRFEIYDTATGTWFVASAAHPYTSAEIDAGHVRFHHDGSSVAPEITVVVSDGSISSTPFVAEVDFTPVPPGTVYHLTSSDGTSIDVGPGGATNGFVLPGMGNATTPGTPEDRIVLGYHLGQNSTPVVVNGSPLMGDNDFTTISHTQVHNQDGSNSVVTTLGAGNNVTLTQTITLGADANFFTTTIELFNGSGSQLTGVRFMRNFDPDQDVQTNGTYNTLNDVIHNPANANDVAIVSAKGAASGAEVALIGLNGDWRASSYGFTNTNPYATQAYGSPIDPNGAQGDQAISLTYDFGSIAAGAHATTTYITTANVATAGSNALFGTDGADSINGLAGDDLLIGLGGADNFVFTAGSGRDTIYDFQTNIDHIDLWALSSIVTQSSLGTWMAQNVMANPLNSADTLITLDSANTILLHNVAYTSLSASDFIVHNTSS